MQPGTLYRNTDMGYTRSWSFVLLSRAVSIIANTALELLLLRLFPVYPLNDNAVVAAYSALPPQSFQCLTLGRRIQ